MVIYLRYCALFKFFDFWRRIGRNFAGGYTAFKIRICTNIQHVSTAERLIYNKEWLALASQSFILSFVYFSPNFARPRLLIEHVILVKYFEEKSRNGKWKTHFYYWNSYHYIRILRASMHICREKKVLELSFKQKVILIYIDSAHVKVDV